MRKLVIFVSVVFLSVYSIANAQDASQDTDSVEYRIVEVISNSDSTANALITLLSEEDETLTAAQKGAVSALPEEAQLFFIELIVSGELATDAAVTTASTQTGITTEMGTDLYDAFAPQLVDIEDEDREGNPLETAADGAAGPVGFGAGAGGGGGGGATASTN